MQNQHPASAPTDLASRNARTGLWLFFLYTTIYAGFVGLAAFSPTTMGQPTPLGPNVAIVYGMGLIVGAVLLALVYMALCRRNAQQATKESQS
jgi:uncharacterized membrane protein (DUF485 family)